MHVYTHVTPGACLYTCLYACQHASQHTCPPTCPNASEGLGLRRRAPTCLYTYLCQHTHRAHMSIHKCITQLKLRCRLGSRMSLEALVASEVSALHTRALDAATERADIEAHPALARLCIQSWPPKKWQPRHSCACVHIYLQRYGLCNYGQ